MVFARNQTKTSLILRENSSLVIAESTVPRWRIYHLTPVSTHLTMLGNDAGLPGGVATRSLEPAPEPVRQLASRRRSTWSR